MALSDVAVPSQISINRAEQTAGTVAVDTIGSGSVFIHQIYINNTLNTTSVYLKLYDSGSSVTVGTTDPDFVFPCAGSSVAEFGIHPGASFGNGIKAAVVTDPGTAGTTSPTSDVSYVIMYGSAEAPGTGA